MTPQYNHQDHEALIYQLWEKSGAFNPDTQQNADQQLPPYTILLPPPNANASLHAGHTMYAIEDVLIRYHRMLGQPTLWIPGTDHAGFETQYVYEKHLSKAGKSRFQFDRETLYRDIYQFVQDNSGAIFSQLKQLGFSCDWSRATFMLDERVVQTVYNTFRKMVDDGLVYRDNYIVNYSPKHGTAFSELETTHVERIDPLYYIKYGPFVVATVRPETMFRDMVLAANPTDPRYTDWFGKSITFQGLLGPIEMRVIPDPEVDTEFGTGIMKVTPAHDAHDFALGRLHGLPVTPVIDFAGKLDLSWFINQTETGDQKLDQQIYLERARRYHGKKVMEARTLIAEDMLANNMLDHVDTQYSHSVVVDYKTGNDIEPMVMPNWFVKMQPLAKPAIVAAQTKQVQFVPARFEKQFYDWLEHIRDWPISRQIVWGIRIPVWYAVSLNPHLEVTFLDHNHVRVMGVVSELLDSGYTLEEIHGGLQQLRAPIDAVYTVSDAQPGNDFLPETDTFDTWFSSGQWPLTTLGYPDSQDFKRFFPTQVLDTMWDILFFWVTRMIMLSLYQTQQVPFATVYLHSMVTDAKGAKMSKSKGNVIDPIGLTTQYGADALRIALIAGSAPGNPIALSENKVKGYRNFANKLWNVGRYIVLSQAQNKFPISNFQFLTNELGINPQPEDKTILNELDALITSSTDNLNRYRFSDYALDIYDFVWNKLASTYLESTKSRTDKETVFTVLVHVFTVCLKLLHPIMPFVTESLWQEWQKAGILKTEDLLITASWPKTPSTTTRTTN